MYSIIKQILFRLDAEEAHELTFSWLERIQGTFLLNLVIPDNRNKFNTHVNIGGLNYRNRLGLAAGLDKNGRLLNVWSRLGFGHIEVGTITPKPQQGNERPRLFRLPEDMALINRMGFNNDGASIIAGRLEKRPKDLIIGANIGKNKDTPSEEAYTDYIKCLHLLSDVCDYFSINISSPNTPGLRDLQHKDELYRLLSEIKNANEKLRVPRPLWVKIAPDISDIQADDILQTIVETGMTGIIATNTTIDRHHLNTDKQIVEAIGYGGMSGKPLWEQSNRILTIFAGGNLPVIGVGGIMTPEDAVRKLEIGAKMIQIYSGLIYHGVVLIGKILASIQNHDSKLGTKY